LSGFHHLKIEQMKSFLRRIFITTLIAGTLDILAAYVQFYLLTHHVSKKMFNYIAGGALGLENSMKGETAVIVLGIFFHYFIAFSFTFFYFLIYKRLKIYLVNKYIAGLCYGIFVWLIMNLVVLPVSKLPTNAITVKGAVTGALILMVMVGLPIAISANSFYKRRII
jgi:hypothetical protein